ncbi:NAD(P)-binding protein [Cryphonectria parasitica EP155]|uniref:NAD(P)-binding protein n=1 Tax=Cryphonectria parasitica (strain ATCC 38755 / EP155) TaxID=660469 RepID=A0A9P4Y2P9_CRYP1|nr:NAD(P)-binding protein [Cryphonectria parasitica EP155]KAF3765355.1 NAD(P)-binding protein [Cryphonectria parasitica EP155]
MAETVLITGCSQGGIGDALAREFHARGLIVFAAARDLTKTSSLKEIGIHTLEMDVTDTASIKQATETVRQATGDHGLDILINNAGVTRILPFADCPVEDMRCIVNTNVLGSFAVTQAFLSMLIQAKGTVANIGSVNEVFAPAFNAVYNASKAALTAFSRTLRAELAPFGVRVVAIRTGGIKTNMTRAEGDRLPGDSLYQPVRETIERRTWIRYDSFPTPEQYAKRVAHDLLGRPGPILWRGGMSTAARLADIFVSPVLLVS